jgi:RNA recognition motif-containing protein
MAAEKVKKEDEERWKREESKRQHMEIAEDANYKREEKVVYVTGFDRGIGMPDLEQFLQKYGQVAHLIRQTDDKGRGKNFVFVEYKNPEAAALAVEDSGRANLMGRRLTINYKMTRVK